MERIFEQGEVKKLFHQHSLEQYFENKDYSFEIRKYFTGEFISTPDTTNEYIQLILSGSLSIYAVRDDGTSYSMTKHDGFYLIGEIELCGDNSHTIFCEATSPVTAIALSINQYKKRLLQDIRFMNLVVQMLSQKLTIVAKSDSTFTTLKERVINHIRYHCPNQTLKGVTQAAFQLHCSDRQLQRILNQLVDEQVLIKKGKGTYQLIIHS